MRPTFLLRFAFMSRASGKALVIFLLLLSVAALAACTHRAYVAEREPPAERVEIVGPPPSPVHVWIAGHWHWTGAEYTWIPGHWLARPHAQATWVPGHWRRVPRGWVWIEGYWS